MSSSLLLFPLQFGWYVLRPSSDVMANGIRTGDPPHWFNKGCSSKFRESSPVRQTPEEGWRTYRLKHCGNNNKDENNSPKTLNDKNKMILNFVSLWYLDLLFFSLFHDCFVYASSLPPPLHIYKTHYQEYRLLLWGLDQVIFKRKYS